MAKTTRWFEIIQILRAATRPVLAANLADRLEVSTRTIYRDIAALQSMNTPIDGEAGIGYMMRKGYDLPALNFNEDEIEALSLGLSMIARVDDSALKKSAASAARKLESLSPALHRLISSSWTAAPDISVEMSVIRVAIRDERKLAIVYHDNSGVETQRTVQPFALIFYYDAYLLAAWCELRTATRHFRLDRMTDCSETNDYFHGQGESMRRKWEKTHRIQMVTTDPLH